MVNSSKKRSKKKITRTKKSSRKKYIILSVILATVVITTLVIIWVRSTQTIDWRVCGKGEMLDVPTNQCVPKPQVIDGAEEGIDDSPMVLNIKDNTGKVVFRVSSGTMIELFTYHKPSIYFDYKTASTGDDYLYIDPSTNTFERASLQEVKEMKERGDVCLDAKDAWNNIGKDTCVTFTPNNAKWTEGYYFFNEQQEYRNGFVAAVMVKFTEWDNLTEKYLNGDAISVYGTIEKYEGHPEIKIYASGAISNAVPIGWNDTYGFIYKNTRKNP